MDRYGDAQSIDVLKDLKTTEFAGNFTRYVVDFKFLPKFSTRCMVHLQADDHMTYHKKIGIPDRSFCILFLSE